MALYKDQQYVKTSSSEAFDKIYPPGTRAPFSGIYRCEGCGDEVASNKNDPLPPQNSHQHNTSAPIRWRLLVFAQSQG